MAKGKFITFEGGEGTGKTTQIGLLSDYLRNRGIETKLTREPGGSPGAEEIRALLVAGGTDRWDAVTETLLHFAARRDHINRIILPALRKGKWVLSDRFFDSTMAYQGYGHRISKKLIDELYRFVAGNLEPDMTILLDLAPKDGLIRANNRASRELSEDGKKEDRYERMSSNFHNRLRKGFLQIARNSDKRSFIIDSKKNIKTIQSEIRILVCERFGIHGRM